MSFLSKGSQRALLRPCVIEVHAFTSALSDACCNDLVDTHLALGYQIPEHSLSVSDKKSSILSGQISGSDTDINSIYVTEASPRTTTRITALDEGAAKEGGGR